MPTFRALLFASCMATLLALPPPIAAAAVDPVAQDLRAVLTIGFDDAEAAAQADPAQACRIMERHWQVFGGMVQEYSTRSGDRSVKLRLERDLRRYCGHGLDAPAPSDGD